MPIDISSSAADAIHQVTSVETRLEQSVAASGTTVWTIIAGRPQRAFLSTIDPEIERDFHLLADRWRRETRQLSSDSDIAGKFAYHQIIGMGENVLPLIFTELQERGGRWYWALRAITRQNPVRPEDRGNVRRMTDAWLQWGRDQGYVR